MRFRLAPRMTVNCFLQDFADLGGNNSYKQMKVDPYRQIHSRLLLMTNRKLHVISVGTKIDDLG